MVRGDSEEGQELTSEECVRAGMYWFGRSDFAAADAWWQRALEIDPANTRAQECLRLLSKSSTTGLEPTESRSSDIRYDASTRPVSDDLHFASEPSSEDLAVLTPGDDGEPSTPMSATSLDDLPAMVLDPSGDLKPPTDADLNGPHGSRDLPPPGNMPHGTAFPFYDDPDPTPPQPTDAFDFAATGQSRSGSLTPSRGATPPSYVSPWDDGPSRTSVLTLDEEEEGYDAVPDPTPLPTIDRERFFGRNEPETEQELVDYLRATGDLPPGYDDAAEAKKPDASGGIVIDEPVEFGRTDDDAAALLTPSQPLDAMPAALLAQGRRRYQLHDFAGALKALESIPNDAPEVEEARNLIASSRQQMLQMYESKIGDFERIPRVLISNEEVIWLNLDHRAGFILSQIDGSVSYEDIISLSGMPRLDTVRILSELLGDRVIGID